MANQQEQQFTFIAPIDFASYLKALAVMTHQNLQLKFLEILMLELIILGEEVVIPIEIDEEITEEESSKKPNLLHLVKEQITLLIYIILNMDFRQNINPSLFELLIWSMLLILL